MGYLLKTDGKVRMFYSKPEQGCYMDNDMMVSLDNYINHYSKINNNNLNDNDFVWMTGWFDISAELHSKESHGIIVDEFTIDCIMQGKFLEENTLYEFGL